ncbi:MAG: DUF2207 domain-containing protein [Pseudomonadota bacterium]
MRLLIMFCVLLVSTWAASAAERILQFDSRVNVQPDGAYIVTETIRVVAEGNRIKRGIFRDFPIVFRDESGNERKVGFELVSAKRDGAPEQSRIERSSRALRIYLGKSDLFLQRGTYTYEIKYRTDRQLRRFDDRVEVYWNATGNFWDFPIERATATIDLPDGASARQTTFFTGRSGSTQKQARATEFNDGNIVKFETTRSLQRREGLTVAVSFDKQFVSAPDEWAQARWFFQDHAASILTYGGALLVFFYYYVVWRRIGRDPPEGVMVPRWDMPEGVSPALVNYIDNEGLRGHGFAAISAALLNLAVKGHVKLEGVASSLKAVVVHEHSPHDFYPGERAVLRELRGAGGSLRFDQFNGAKVKSLVDVFKGAMEKEHRGVYFKSNLWHILPGLLLSIATLFLTIAFAPSVQQYLGPLLVFTVGGGFFCLVIFRNILKFRQAGLKNKIGSVMNAGFAIMIAMIVGVNFLFALPELWSASSQISKLPGFIGGLMVLVVVNALFYFLMGAPTPLGRQRMDEIAGLKRYLTVAEADRMNMRGAPEMSPQHYEKLLPYAVALGVEKPWSNAFQSWLSTSLAAGSVAAASYHGPSWYDGGTDFNPGSIGSQMSDIGSGIADSLTSSMPAPESSSSGFSGGGGGGSSGGGGGGGGGGGW